MRWSSAGLFAVLIGLILVAGSGCRELSTENTDRNRAPETFLSAAPLDSIAGGGLTRVAHRYRAAWSGADIDGEVVGFFVAVTETTIDANTGVPLRLPAPRPSQYRFTTSRESLFVFSVLEGRGSDRQHALYVYAVDNQGRVDATPAVSHFVARDQNLPTVRFLLAEGSGTVFKFDESGQLVPTIITVPLGDSTEVPPHAPRDTIPSGGSARFGWKGEDKDFASYITGYLYKLVENELVRVDSNTTTAEYGTGFGPQPGPIPTGANTFRVRAIDEAGGTTQPDAVRQFFVNFGPDTWFAGPDVTEYPQYLASDSLGTYFPAEPTSNRIIDFPGNPFGADTLQTLPAERKAMDGLNVPRTAGGPSEFRPKTFLEGRNRLDKQFRWYVRQEGDTVAYASALLARIGGFDRDSPYNVRGGTPDNVYPLLRSGPQNGSPVAFVGRVAQKLDVGGSISPAFTTPFPNIDPTDPFNNPVVLFTQERIEGAGIGYMQVRAVDGNRTSDIRIGDPLNDGEFNALTPAIRSKILTFPINFRPGIMTITPVANQLLDPPSDRISVVIRCTDPDPDPLNPRPPGGDPAFNAMYFSIRARVYDDANDPPAENSGWQDPVLGYFSPDITTPGMYPYSSPITLDLVVPPTVPAGLTALEIEVLDNPNRTQARAIRLIVPFYWRVGP